MCTETASTRTKYRAPQPEVDGQTEKDSHVLDRPGLNVVLRTIGAYRCPHWNVELE